MKVCGICSHASRSDIDAALVSGTPLRVIAGQYGTGKSALDRHRKHIPTALAKAKEAIEVADASSLLSRVENLVSRCEMICDRATAAGKWVGAAAAARELRGCLELLGKLSGELQPKGAKVAINFGDITKIDIHQLSDEQLEALSERVRVDNQIQMASMSTEEIEAELLRIVLSHAPNLITSSETILFDDVTVSPGPGIEANRRYDAMMAERYAADGRRREESPWRDASPLERYWMLQAAWKRETSKDLCATLEDLGAYALMEIEFDFTENQHRTIWPKVRLKYAKPPERQ